MLIKSYKKDRKKCKDKNRVSIMAMNEVEEEEKW